MPQDLRDLQRYAHDHLGYAGPIDGRYHRAFGQAMSDLYGMHRRTLPVDMDSNDVDVARILSDPHLREMQDAYAKADAATKREFDAGKRIVEEVQRGLHMQPDAARNDAHPHDNIPGIRTLREALPNVYGAGNLPMKDGELDWLKIHDDVLGPVKDKQRTTPATTKTAIPAGEKAQPHAPSTPARPAQKPPAQALPAKALPARESPARESPAPELPDVTDDFIKTLNQQEKPSSQPVIVPSAETQASTPKVPVAPTQPEIAGTPAPVVALHALAHPAPHLTVAPTILPLPPGLPLPVAMGAEVPKTQRKGWIERGIDGLTEEVRLAGHKIAMRREGVQEREAARLFERSAIPKPDAEIIEPKNRLIDRLEESVRRDARIVGGKIEARRDDVSQQKAAQTFEKSAMPHPEKTPAAETSHSLLEKLGETIKEDIHRIGERIHERRARMHDREAVHEQRQEPDKIHLNLPKKVPPPLRGPGN